MRLRYTGADESRDIAVRGGLIVCPRMKWIDVTAEAEANGIAPGHAEVVARDIATQDDWQLESTVKAARTRAKNRAAAEETAQEQAPPEGEEQS